MGPFNFDVFRLVHFSPLIRVNIILHECINENKRRQRVSRFGMKTKYIYIYGINSLPRDIKCVQ